VQFNEWRREHEKGDVTTGDLRCNRSLAENVRRESRGRTRRGGGGHLSFASESLAWEKPGSSLSAVS